MNTNKTWKYRIAAALLCTLTILPAVSACGDAPTEPEAGKDTQPTETAAPVTEAVDENAEALQSAIANMPKVDYGDYEFTVLDRNDVQDFNWVTIDVFSEGENADTINDAVYQRNRIIEEGLNIKIKDMPVDYPYQTAKTAIMASDNSFDVLTDGIMQLAQVATAGYFMDLHTVPGLALENPWWDQEMNRDLSITDHLFFCTGDISIMDNYGTWCVMFNKSIANEYDINNIYELVKTGKWTIDEMYAMTKMAAKDLNGDGKQDQDDQWGLFTEGYNEYPFWASSGEKIISKDEDDVPVLSAYNDRSVAVIEKVSALQKDANCTLIADNVTDGCAFTNEAFGNGKGLFIYGGMWLITKFRAYDINFGVVPSPKYDEAQERYYNSYSYSNLTAYSVPKTAENLERIGTIMETMAQISKYTLTPAYYDIALKGKYIRDEESADMLDIILASRSYDLGNIFNWGNMFTMITNLSTTNTDFTSQYQKYEKSALTAIEKFVNNLDVIE